MNDKVLFQIADTYLVERTEDIIGKGRCFVLAKSPQDYVILTERRFKEELDDLVDRLRGHSDRVK